MTRTLFTLSLCLLSLIPALGQDGPHLRDSVAASPPDDTLRSHYLIRLARHYWMKPSASRRDIDSAAWFNQEGRTIAIRHKNYYQYALTLYYEAQLYLKKNEPKNAIALIPVLNEYAQVTLYHWLAHYYLYKPYEYRYDLDSSLYFSSEMIRHGKAFNRPYYVEEGQRYYTYGLIESKRNAESAANIPLVAAKYQARQYYLLSLNYWQHNVVRTPELLDTADLYALKALRMAAAGSDTLTGSQASFQLAITALYRRDYPCALPYFPSARGVEKAEICLLAAFQLLQAGRGTDSARRYADTAYALFRQAKKQPFQDQSDTLLHYIATLEATAAKARQASDPAAQYEIWMETAVRYLDPQKRTSQALSSAVYCLHQNIRLAQRMNNDHYRLQSWIRMGQAWTRMNLLQEADRYYYPALELHKKNRDTAALANLWHFMNKQTSFARIHYPYKLHALKQANKLYEATGDNFHIFETRLEQARLLLDDSRPVEAGAIFETLLRRFPAEEHAPSVRILLLQARIAQQRGDNSTALRYALTGLRAAEKNNQQKEIRDFHLRLAEIYGDLGNDEQSFAMYLKGLEVRENTLHHFDYASVVPFTELMIRLRGPQETLAFIENVRHKWLSQNFYTNAVLAGALARCYQALGKIPEAEVQYGISVTQLDTSASFDNIHARLFYNFATLYIEQQHYRKAAEHLERALRMRPENVGVGVYRNLQYMLFQCDSALGKPQEAIAHYQRYKYYSDSLFNITKSRQIAELHIQYETEKKEQSLLVQEQELRYRAQEIELLMKKGQLQVAELDKATLAHQQAVSDAHRKEQDIKLKEKDIAFLRQEALLQDSKLEQERLMRNVSFGGAGLLIIIIGLLVNGYRLKQNHNLSLQEKQIEIGQKNASLEKLLTEKEWLLKEIHHRVKNNLQIVMSLLNSQGAYLQNDAALTAIRDSQHRVQAISLIHKKLYQSDNVGLIFMPHYIHELVDYLADCFDTGRQIQFKPDVAPVHLDVSQAVPLGLILNEAITNAIKYAFPGNMEGCILVRFDALPDGCFELNIADNGRGLPVGFDPGACGTLGMNLMEGLSNDLGGRFSIRDAGGTDVRVSFTAEPFIRRDLRLTAPET